MGWEPVPVWQKQEQKQKGVLTWRDSVKIGCGVAMAPYIFAIITLFIYAGVSIALLVFDVFSQDGIGFLVEQFGILIDWLQNLVSERTGEKQ